MDDLVPLIGLIVAVFVIVLALRAVVRRIFRPSAPPPPRQRRPTQPPAPAPTRRIETNPRSILVDGSNVMFWIDNTPTVEALQRVLAALRNAGNDPILCFDANIGYKLVNLHMNPSELARFFGVAERNILICPSGTDADAMILDIAVKNGLPVVTNDRYRDYPDQMAQVRRMTGQIKDREVKLRLRNLPGSGQA